MQGNWGDSWLLMVESQIGHLIPDPSFGHNLCFKYSNGWCKPILNIYVSKYFQWYKELLNPMNFDPCNHPLKIWESIGTPIPKVRAHLGVWGFIPSLSCTPGNMKCDSRAHSWPTLSQAFILVVNPKLGLQHSLSQNLCIVYVHFQDWP